MTKRCPHCNKPILAKSKACRECATKGYEPTQERIAQLTARIRKRWSEYEEQQRVVGTVNKRLRCETESTRLMGITFINSDMP